MAGGINLFAYVGGDPVNWFDPNGLVKWTGTYRQSSMSAFVGATFIKYIMTSECIDNKKAIVTVYAVGPTGALGLEASLIDGKTNMHDFNDTINPNAFNGGFANIGATIAVGVGGSISKTTVGHVYSDGPVSIDTVKGGDVSVGVTIGTSTVMDIKWEKCCSE